jgi:hypothetical protein
LIKLLEAPISVQRPQIIITSSVGTFLAMWSLVHGVPVQQALLLTIFTLGLSTSGALAWEWLCLDRRPHPLESFAAGFVLASSAVTLVDQVLVQWNGRYEVLRWVYGVLSIAYLVRWTKRSSASLSPDHENWEFVLPLAFSAVTIGLTGAHGWAVATVLFLLLTYLLYEKKLRSNNAWGLLLTNVSILVAIGMIFLFRPPFTMTNWHLFRMFTGSDDQIFSEAASNSLVLLGPFDSIFSLNTHVPYHWFTFAWSGNLGHLIDGDAFTATLHIASPLGLLYTALLVWAVVFNITMKKSAGLIAIIATFATSSLTAPHRFFYLINTSNVVSHLWLLLALLLLVRLLSSSIRFGIPLLCIVSAIALIAKVPYGIVLYSGLGIAFLGAFISTACSLRNFLKAIGSLMFTALVTFKIFLEPQPWQDRGFKVLVNSGNFLVDSALYPLAPIALISVIAITRFPYYLASRLKSDRKLRPLILFFLGSTTFSLVRFFVVGASAEIYFLGAGLLFAGVGVGVFWGSVERELSETEQRRLKLFALASCCMTLAVAIAIPTREHSNWLVLFPLLLGIVGTAFYVKSNSGQSSSSLLIATSTTFAAILLGSGVGNFLRVSLNKPEIEPASVVSTNEIESLTWIRRNTNIRDLLASNRNLCGDTPNCSHDETRQVIAAFADRQVLIEGPRFLNGAQSYPDWARKRINDVLYFSTSPSERSLDILRTYGVDWFYLVKTDPRAAPMSDFEGLATPIVFENSDIAVIDLRND